MDYLHEEEGKVEVLLYPKFMMVTCMHKRLKIKSLQNAAEEGEDQVQLNPERHGDHMHAEQDELQI